MSQIASTLWLAGGGPGDVPDALVAAVGAHLSPHFTAAVMTDVGHSWKRAADLAYESIMAAQHAELANAVA